MTAAKNFDTSSGPFSVSKLLGVPYGTTQLSTISVAVLIELTLVTAGPCQPGA